MIGMPVKTADDHLSAAGIDRLRDNSGTRVPGKQSVSAAKNPDDPHHSDHGRTAFRKLQGTRLSGISAAADIPPDSGFPDVADHAMPLKTDLAECGPNDSGRLTRIYRVHYQTEGFLSRLIRYGESTELEQQATWLIKRYLETGHPATRRESSRIVSMLDSAAAWQATLHILQSIRHLAITDSDRQICFASLRGLIRHRRSFVRAWAYDALYALAQQDDELRDDAMRLFFLALDDEAASVQARIRIILSTK